jgi:hypothetical protein
MPNHTVWGGADRDAPQRMSSKSTSNPRAPLIFTRLHGPLVRRAARVMRRCARAGAAGVGAAVAVQQRGRALQVPEPPGLGDARHPARPDRPRRTRQLPRVLPAAGAPEDQLPAVGAGGLRVRPPICLSVCLLVAGAPEDHLSCRSWWGCLGGCWKADYRAVGFVSLGSVQVCCWWLCHWRLLGSSGSTGGSSKTETRCWSDLSICLCEGCSPASNQNAKATAARALCSKGMHTQSAL